MLTSRWSRILRVSQLAPHGLWLPLAFMAVGTAWPELGRAALAGIPLWSFAVVLFGVLSMSAGPVNHAEAAVAVAIIAAVTLLSPLLSSGTALLLHVSSDLRGLMVIAACSPIAPPIGALAVILKLPDKGAVIAAITTALAAPLVLPLANHVLAHDALAISAWTLALRAAMLVMVPVVLAFLIRWTAPARCALWRTDFRGMAVLALSMFAAARGPGLRYGLTAPILAIKLTLLVCVVAVLAMMAGWALTMVFQRENRLAATFASGMRNVPAAWAALGNTLDPAGVLFMTLSVVPFYIIPVVMRIIVRWSERFGDSTNSRAAGRVIKHSDSAKIFWIVDKNSNNAEGKGNV